MSTLRDGLDVIAMLRELGRGPNTARPLSRAQARDLFEAMLSGAVDDLTLGALLIAYRVKGEEAVELAGMLDAAQDTLKPLVLPASSAAPVSIPSYNGARRLPNLVPLLALSLAKRGIPVLVHGDPADAYGRISSASVFAALGVSASTTHARAQDALAHGRADDLAWPGLRVAFLSTEVLSPRLARMLALRDRLGLRNSAHTVVKLLDPFAGPSLRLVNFTHPPYRDAMAELLTRHVPPAAPGALLARGCEGEAVADPRRDVAIERLADGNCSTLVVPLHSIDSESVALPAIDAASTARWIEEVLAGEARMPPSLARQIDAIASVCERATTSVSIPAPTPPPPLFPRESVP